MVPLFAKEIVFQCSPTLPPSKERVSTPFYIVITELDEYRDRCVDTGDNMEDFQIVDNQHTPRNSYSPFIDCNPTSPGEDKL